MRPYRAPAACCVVLMLAAAGVFVLRAAAQPAPRDGIAALLRQLERTAAAADAPGILALGAPAISRPIFQEFARSLTTPAPTRVVVNERDRAPLERRSAAGRRSVQRAWNRGTARHLARRRPARSHASAIPGGLPRSPGCRSSPAFIGSRSNTTKQYRHSQPGRARARSGDRDDVRARVRCRDARRTDRARAARARAHAVHSAGSRRAHPGPASSAAPKRWRPTSTWRSCGSLPATSRRASTPGRSGRSAGERRRTCAPRSAIFNDAHRRIPPGRPARSQPRSLVADCPRPATSSRELRTEEVRHAHVRAIRQRSGRHHALRSQAADGTSRSTRRPQSWPSAAASTARTSSQDYDVLAYDIDAEFTPERGIWIEGNAQDHAAGSLAEDAAR